MFDFKRALNSTLQTHPDDKLTALSTTWGENINPECVLPEYPRPQMKRNSYVNLNGHWDYAFLPEGSSHPEKYDGQILVPFSPECTLSGVNRQLQPGEMLWYRRTVQLTKKPGMRYLLHFEAVDFECECFVNGGSVGRHRGGYQPFTFDITDEIGDGMHMGDTEISLRVTDPSEYGVQPRGKQRIDRGSIWYTAQSGIWQTVWLEEVPEAYIAALQVMPNADAHNVAVEATVNHPDGFDGASLKLRLYADGALIAETESSPTEASKVNSEIALDDVHLWSPEDPYLYKIEIEYGKDKVASYCAFRTFTVEEAEEGKGKVFCLNHKPFFLKGLLDQGYWPDGLLTAPSDEALIFDIELARNLGFNMLRKHIKVEPSRWYYHCDRLGMIVFQDMVNGGGKYSDFYTSQLPTVLPALAKRIDDTKNLKRFGSDSKESQDLWKECARETIEHLRFFPCIATWVVFNEGWGQFDASKMTEMLNEIDPTRPFDQASGWFDQGGGDFISQHNYFRDITVPKGLNANDTRAPFISEFGGIAYHIVGHSSLERAYGYEMCDTGSDFAVKLFTTLIKADNLAEKGLSGYVYTQLSDVEEEVNGLVTYDRKVVKLIQGSE